MKTVVRTLTGLNRFSHESIDKSTGKCKRTPYIFGIQCRQPRSTYRLRSRRQIAVERIHSKIVCPRHGQSRYRFPQESPRQVIFVLSVEVYLLTVLILDIRIYIFVPRVIVFCQRLHAPLLGKLVFVLHLHKTVLVPKTFIGLIAVKDDRSGKSAFRIEIISLHADTAVLIYVVMNIAFNMPGMHIAVLTLFFSNIFTVDKPKRIFAISIQKIARQRTDCAISQTLRPSERRIYHAERTTFNLSAELIFSISVEENVPAEQFQHTGRSKSTRRLHQFAVLPYRKRKRFNVVKAKSTYVYLSCLTIADGHTVVYHSSVLCTKTSDRNSFQSAYSAVVLHIGTSKSAHCIGYILKAQSFQFLSSNNLCRIRHSISLRRTPGAHRHIRNVVYTPCNAVVQFTLRLYRQRSKNGQQYGKTQAGTICWSPKFHQLSV